MSKLPPALRAGSDRLFQVCDLYRCSPESCEVKYKSRRLKKTICPPPWGLVARDRWMWQCGGCVTVPHTLHTVLHTVPHTVPHTTPHTVPHTDGCGAADDDALLQVRPPHRHQGRFFTESYYTHSLLQLVRPNCVVFSLPDSPHRHQGHHPPTLTSCDLSSPI